MDTGSLTHILLLVAIVASGAILIALAAQGGPKARKIVLIILAVAASLLALSQPVWHLYRGNFNLHRDLPLSFCNIAALLMLLFILPKARDFIYASALPAAVLTLAFPAVTGATLMSFTVLQYIALRAVLLWIAVYLIVCMGFRPKLRRLPIVIVLSVAAIIPAVAANLLMTNAYYATFLKDRPGSFVGFFVNYLNAPWDRIAPAAAILIVWMVLSTLPFPKKKTTVFEHAREMAKKKTE